MNSIDREDDRLEEMFILRKEFMQHLEAAKPGTYPTGTVDVSRKEAQQLIRDLALKGVEEMFEALQHLKNWKSHRDTDIPEFNREDFLEEVVDSFNYFLSMLVLVGVDSQELYDAYASKNAKLHARLKNGY